MNLSLLRHGFLLILLGLLTGFLVPALALPRLALAAHTIALLSGAFLILLGAIWAQFTLSRHAGHTMKWLWIYSSYANWLGCLIGAATGAGKMTPIAAMGSSGPLWAETLVAILLISVGITALIAAILSLWGLRVGSNKPAT